MITLSHSLCLCVIAEGVEEAEERAFLIEQGCDEMQGYLFSGQVLVSVFVKFLREAAPVHGSM